MGTTFCLKINPNSFGIFLPEIETRMNSNHQLHLLKNLQVDGIGTGMEIGVKMPKLDKIPKMDQIPKTDQMPKMVKMPKTANIPKMEEMPKMDEITKMPKIGMETKWTN